MGSIYDMAVTVAKRQNEDYHICYGCNNEYDCDVSKMFIIECAMYDVAVIVNGQRR